MEPGFELALAAVLGPRLTAGVVNDRTEGERLLDSAGADGATILLSAARRGQSGSFESGAAPASPSVPTGRLLAQLVRPEREIAALAERLLANVWVVDALSALPDSLQRHCRNTLRPALRRPHGRALARRPPAAPSACSRSWTDATSWSAPQSRPFATRRRRVRR